MNGAFNRRVFYLGGFDPRGVRFYHHMALEQIAAHAAKTGEDITVSGRTRAPRMTVDWTVTNASAGVATRCTFLRWDDFVARAWIRKPLALAAAMIGAYWGFIWHVRWLACWRLCKGPVITLAYPLAFTIALPLAVAVPLALLLGLVMPGWAAFAAALVAGIAFARPRLIRMHTYWLVRLFISSHRIARDGFSAEMEERIAGFAAAICEALDGDADEVLFVSHSNGTIPAALVMLRLMERRGGTVPGHFAMVTMGHCIPLVSARRDAGFYHAQLRALSAHAFDWYDIGSPADGAAFSLVDPLRPAASHGAIRLTLLSPRLHLFYDPENYDTGFANKYELHFDYLRSGDRVSPVGYPSLIASRRTIAEAATALREIP